MGRARAFQRVTSWVQHERELSLRDGALRLGCVADTHSAPHPNTEPLLRALHVDAILHGGDIGDLGVLDQLAAVAPLLAVRGNIDERANELPDGITLRIRSGTDTVLTMLLMHIVVAGPRVRKEAAQLAHEQGAQLIVCGHSHVPFIGRDKGLTVFNPGSIGPRRMRLPIVLGVLEIANGKLSLRHVDCETGEEWKP
ncbi:MAG TPA: metallophosphoesterase family protein [Polyangiales bacterium]